MTKEYIIYMYYIYHIPGKKIGCTDNLQRRMKQQEFSEWEILEKYRNIYTASKREIQLQREYGLPVDQIPYWQTRKNQLQSKEAIRTSEAHANARLQNVSKTWHCDDRKKAVAKGSAKIVQCPRCKKEGAISGMARWHFDNCKYQES